MCVCRTNLQLHTQNCRETFNAQLLRRLLRRIPTALAVVRVGHQFLRRREALQTTRQRRRGRERIATAAGGHVSLLRLDLHVQTQVQHGILRLRDVAAPVAGYAAADLAKEGLVEEAAAFALGLVVVVESLRRRVEPVDEELVELVRVLLRVAGESLDLEGRYY